MVNLINLMPEWNWLLFDEIMRQAQTKHIELVPGMLLGSEWEKEINQPSAASKALALMMSSYTVTSIQSLTYGLNINLADAIYIGDDVVRRFQSLAHLGELLKCRVFVLGSPGQKKLSTLYEGTEAAKKQFIENCAWMASVLAPKGTLSIEHNTKTQGAEFCNSLRDVSDVVIALRERGVYNVGINLDTKCLLHEFGDNVHLTELIDAYSLGPIVTSIQVSLDFLLRTGSKARSDEKTLLQLAQDQCLPISLEEFGLLNEQLKGFISLWQAANSGLLKKSDQLQRSLFQLSRPAKLPTNKATNDCHNC
jgi:hypothetical protein